VLQDTVVKGWFDDRVEARSALSKLTYLDQLSDLSRNKLPWGNAIDEMDTVIGEFESKGKQEADNCIIWAR
jgi:hypothetical protein